MFVCLSVCLCPCLPVSVSPPSPAQLFQGGKKTTQWRLSTFYSKEAKGRSRSLLQLRCQQLAWQKCSQPDCQIPVTIIKRLLQTSLSKASSQEEWGPLILSGAKRIGGWNGDRPGCWPGLQPALFVQNLCTAELARLSWASARVSWVSERLPVHWTTLLSGKGWAARKGPVSGRHPLREPLFFS